MIAGLLLRDLSPQSRPAINVMIFGRMGLETREGEKPWGRARTGPLSFDRVRIDSHHTRACPPMVGVITLSERTRERRTPSPPVKLAQ